MVAWLADHFDWNGRTSRDEYRRWLPLIVAVQILAIWGVAEFGRLGTINFVDFGLWGLALGLVCLPFAIGWVVLTARRLKSAGLTRSWLLLGLFNIPIGVFVTISVVVSVLLIAVAALVPDESPANAT